MMKRYLFLAITALVFLGSAGAQNVFNCSSFASTGTCGVGSGQNFRLAGGVAALSGSQLNFIPAGTTHAGTGLNYFTPVNAQSFTANFTFVPNGQNVAFVLQNTNNNSGYDGTSSLLVRAAKRVFSRHFVHFRRQTIFSHWNWTRTARSRRTDRSLIVPRRSINRANHRAYPMMMGLTIPYE